MSKNTKEAADKTKSSPNHINLLNLLYVGSIIESYIRFPEKKNLNGEFIILQFFVYKLKHKPYI